MRQILYRVVHCTASSQFASLEAILRFWKEERGWTKPGYHRLVFPDGKVVKLLNDDEVSNGVQGHNSVSLNVAYVGGVDASGNTSVDTRTAEQKKALREILCEWVKKYPGSQVMGHRDFKGVKKTCPNFDVKSEYV